MPQYIWVGKHALTRQLTVNLLCVLQYICVGYSVYEEAQLRESWRDGKAPGTPLQVHA